jgi:hypothetical protein
MATSDSELIAEARALTEYDTTIIDDVTFQELVDICKEEIRSALRDEEFSFYQTEDPGSLAADRALFWMVCIAAKIRTGELAGMNIEVSELRMQNPGHIHHETWFRNFRQQMVRAEQNQASSNGPANITLSRTNRTYGDNA